MGLLLSGATRSLRAQRRPAPGLLCAAYAWTSANGSRATWDRAFELRHGGALDYGPVELWAVGGATILALMCFASCIHFVLRAERARE